MTERTIEALVSRIRHWEMTAGESFTDYYMDGRVKEVSWAFWLLGKGYKERANFLIDQITAREYISQEDKFEIYSQDETWSDWNASNAVYLMDVSLWAEFLIASDRYWKDILEWFEEEEDSWGMVFE